MRKRDIYILASVVVLLSAAAVVVAVLWRRSVPPQAARLLPAADTYVYADLRPLRAANVLRNLPAVEHDAEYDQFVSATGFQWERDLDQVALAAHRPPQDAAPGAETRYSEVFVGRFDRGKVAAYLRKMANATERYRDLDIYAITLPGRTLRVAVLNQGMVAAANTEGPYVIHQIVDRYSGFSLAQGAPELLRRYYSQVPLTAVAWGVSQLAAAGGGNHAVELPGGYNFMVPADTVLVASLRYAGGVRLRAQVLSANEADAQRVSDQLSALLALFRTVETSTQTAGGDPDVQGFFQSISVTREDASTVVAATIPPGFAKKVIGEK